jgi:hypothetical protein
MSYSNRQREGCIHCPNESRQLDGGNVGWSDLFQCRLIDAGLIGFVVWLSFFAHYLRVLRSRRGL